MILSTKKKSIPSIFVIVLIMAIFDCKFYENLLESLNVLILKKLKKVAEEERNGAVNAVLVTIIDIQEVTVC